MIEIEKCDGFISGNLCVNKDQCLRYNKKPNDLLQAWVKPSYGHNGKCIQFIKDYTNEKNTTKKFI